MKEQIDDLNERASFHYDKYNEYTDAIKALRKVCDHDWQFIGHGHRDSLYTCNICGEDEHR